MSPDARGLICLFAKHPIPGCVKTRLARHLGADRAADLARAFLDDTIAALRQLGRPFVVALDGPGAGDIARGERVVLQGEGDLGVRMTRVMRELLCDTHYVIALGADTPGLPLPFIETAAALLDAPSGPDFVVGPTSDGGFYLLGVRALAPTSFDGVRWSTAHARTDVEQRFRAQGLRQQLLPAWFDVDEVADLARLMEQLEHDPSLFAPATRRALGLTPTQRSEAESA